MPRKRLPLTGTYNTRSGTVGASGVTSIVDVAIVDISIVEKTLGASEKDHRWINCFPITETDSIGGSKRLYIADRAGFASNSTPRSGHVGNAILVWSGQSSKLMSCFGNTNFKLYDGTTDSGDGTGKATSITETTVSGTPTLYITSDDNKGWTYQNGGALTNINDADFPGNASRTITGAFAHLDGYPFIMDTTGRIYNGDLNSASAWTAASYVTANSIPDVGVGVVRHRNTLVGFCRRHFDVFRNAGNPVLSPLGRIEELSQLIGCIGQHAITSVGDVIYFIGTTDKGNIGLYAYDGGAAKKVSRPEHDAALAVAGPSNITITIIVMFGRHFVYITAATATYAFCIEENEWHEVVGSENLWYKSTGTAAGSNVLCYAISKTSTTGKIFVLNPGNVVYADNGLAYSASIQTAKWDAGTSQYKFMNSLDIIGDQVTGTWNVAVSDDDYMNFSTARTIDMSSKRQRAHRWGRFTRRAFALSHTANGARVEALEPEFELGRF